MKSLIAAIGILLSTATACAQNGAVNFANRLAGVFDAPVVVPALNVGAGEFGAVAQLFIVNGTSLTPVGTPIGFRAASGPLAKYFDGGALELPGTSVGGDVTLRVLSWVGSSFEKSVARFETSAFTITNLGGGMLPPSNLVTMTRFILPEPSALVLALIGAAALAAQSRRKQ